MEKQIHLTHSKKKLDMALGLGYSDYGKRYDENCKAWGFKCRFADKYGEGVYAWWDQSGTAAENFKLVFVWMD